jgi:microtubule-associated protein-like 6
MIGEIALETMARSLAWSPDGNTLGVGLGGRTRRGRSKKDGAFLVIDVNIKKPNEMTIKHEARDSREWISECKFSPDGKTFAIGSHDNKIYLYDVAEGYVLKAKCERHSSFISHFDFSENSAYIQSNCGAYELLFYNSSDGVQILNPSSLKDERWATWTCALGWPVQGVWPEVYDGNDINACCKAKTKDILATVDEFGKIQVFKWPALDKRAKRAYGYGHASHCTNVRFAVDDEFLVTLGGRDRTVMQWRVVMDKPKVEDGAGGELVVAGAGEGKKKKR